MPEHALYHRKHVYFVYFGLEICETLSLIMTPGCEITWPALGPWEGEIRHKGISAPEHRDVNRCIDLLAQNESAHEIHSQLFYHRRIVSFPFVIL